MLSVCTPLSAPYFNRGNTIYPARMKKRTAPGTSGQFVFIKSEHAETIMPDALRMAPRDPNERARVRSRYAEFCEQVRSVDLHKLLSLTGLYTLTGSMGQLQRQASYPELAELEFLQAVALTGNNSAAPQLHHTKVKEFWRELSAQCYAASNADRDNSSGLDRLARSHAAYYRNPYGDDFFDRMVVAITQEYDARYIRTGNFAKMGLAIVTLRKDLWQRYRDHFEYWRIAQNGDRPAVVALLKQFMPSLHAGGVEAEFGELEIKGLRSVAFNAVEDRAIEQLFVLDSDWIATHEANGLPMGALLNELSLSHLDELSGENLAADNPVWTTPVVKRGDGYALYSPYTLASFPFRCILSLLKSDDQAKTRIEKIRGWYVEQEGRRLLEQAFPSAQVVLGGFWYRKPSERVEADLLVLVSDRLFILEAKGALIPDRVRFGARDATAQFLKRIWGRATEQGAALANHLENASEPVEITNDRGSVVMTLDPEKLRSVSRLGISIEQVGPLMNAPEMLRDAGVLDKTALAAPCILLSELEQVFKLAPDELHKFHYFLRRSNVATDYQIIGDEMDIYTAYLQFGFSELPQEEKTLMLLGASYSLDGYRDKAGTVQLPSDSALRCSPYFQEVLREARRRGTSAYLDIGLLLLDMPYTRQLELEREFKKAFKKTPKGGNWPIIMTTIDAPGERVALSIVMVDKTATLDEHRKVGMKAAATAGAMNQADYAACLTRTHKAPNAYDALYVLARTLTTKRAVREQSRSEGGSA